MTTLSFGQGEARDFLTRLLDTPDLAQVVPSLEPGVLHQLIRHVGLEECGEVIALATSDQLTHLFDEDLWRGGLPGTVEQFDVDRFGLWLEVLSEAGDGVAAEKLVAMDFDFVTAAMSRQLLVVDHQALMLLLSGKVEDGIVPADPMPQVLADLGINDGDSHKFRGYTVYARRRNSWDALLSVLTNLDHKHPAFLARLLARCCQFSTEFIDDNGGLFDVLTSDQQIIADAADAREERRRSQGHVAPLEAQAFLKLARTGKEDHVTAAYFRDRKVVARSEAAGDSLLPGISAAGPLGRIRALLASVDCTEELAYLANVLVAGCSFQSRRFHVAEAADAVLAVCNLGLENGSRDLMSAFRNGWRILYEDVSLFTAKRLIDALSDLHCDDRDIQGEITVLKRRMRKQIAAGTPWLERDNLHVIAILDPPSWAMLVNLLDECALVPKNACTPSERPALRVATEFEFISENRQIAWAREFALSLPGSLT